MKKNLNFLLKLTLMGILLTPPLIYTTNLYNYADSQNKTNWYNQKRFEDFYALEPNTLDIAFLGSSHSYCTFDPFIFNDILNVSSFQFGMPLQHIDMSYYTLLEILNYQKPKVVVLEIYFDMLDDDYVNEPVNDLISVIQNEEIIELINNEVRPLNEQVKQNINFIKNQSSFLSYKNKELMTTLEDNGYTQEEIEVEGEEFYKGYGYISADYSMPLSEYDETNQFKNYDGKNFEISKVQKDYIYKISELAEENDIQLIFVTAPLANVSMDYIQNYDYIHNTINEIAQDLDVPYIDYNLIDVGLENENFRDDAHLNDSGANIVSTDLAYKIKNNTNFKGDF